jgi:hypothetical protein
MLNILKTESKNPRTIITVILVVCSVFLLSLYTKKADEVTVTQKQFESLVSDTASMHSSVLAKDSVVSILNSTLSDVQKKLQTSDSSNVWYAKNWRKETIITNDKDGSSTTHIIETANDSGGTADVKKKTKDSDSTASSTSVQTVEVRVYVHDTTYVDKKVARVDSSVKTSVTISAKPGRLYVNAGGYATQGLNLGTRTTAGFSYAFLPLAYLDVHAQHDGITDWATGYSVAATVGLKLDF